MRKTYRSSKSSRRATPRARKNRRTFARASKRWTSRTHRKTARRTFARSTAKKIVKRWPTVTPSPFAKVFIAGCRKGQPCYTVINSICKRTGKSFNTVCASLCKAGVCHGQKFNGQWICRPNFKTPVNTYSAKQAQWNLWQGFVDWCVTSGYCTPVNLNKFASTGKQAQFMKNCQSLINRQCSVVGVSKVKAVKSVVYKTSVKPYGAWQTNPLAWSRSFAFPNLKTFTRRFARAS